MFIATAYELLHPVPSPGVTHSTQQGRDLGFREAGHLESNNVGVVLGYLLCLCLPIFKRDPGEYTISLSSA